MNRLRTLSGILLLLWLSLFWFDASSAQPSVLRSGPMVGYGEMTEVMLWGQTTQPAAVQIRYWDQENPGERFLSDQVRTTAERAYVAHVRISGLKPGKRFGYEILINGEAIARPYPLAFQTQPLWQYRADPPEFTVALGSCVYISEPEWDRPGNPYGGEYEILTSIAALKPDLMLWLGDNTYYREVDWNTVSGMRYRYSHTRAVPEMQPLLGAAHNYAIWDDHDYGTNNSDRSFRMRSESLDTFRLFWANPTYGTDEVKGAFTRFEWGDVEFFLLDDRYHRSPNDAPNDEAKTMFGKGQLEWLMDCLVSSRAPFKVIAGGNQMLNPIGPFEAFSNYAHEYTQLLDYIKKQRIPGIIFLSGDRHITELIRLDDSSFYPLYDYTSSPLTAGPSGGEPVSPARVEGTWVNNARNFGLLRFTGPRRERKVTLECYDVKGRLLWSRQIDARQLRPPGEGR